ncbi:MAG: efflux RND transporter periplasmic adaptor subunit [Lachnospiraceae bacterium]|nr:efflux RND transporter periplasmic adaptor subunit [Lachnospiraceae bacterium]
MKKKLVIIFTVIFIIIGFITVAFFVWKGKKVQTAEGLCYVESVASITGSGMTWNNRYMGIVETQEVTKVSKDSEKVVKEIFVEEQDAVKEGDKLFEYDTDEMTLKLRQLELELTSYYNSISTMYDQIETLVAERENAPDDQKIEYTSQIQNLQAQINQTSYDANSKQLEIDRQKSAISNSVVYAPVDGVISNINNQENQSEQYMNDYYGGDNGEGDAFISIMAMGDFRIKGTVSELNAYSLSEGMPVLVRSRVDESIIWTGAITKVDLEHPVSNDNMYYDGPGENATKYPFYVQVDSSEGMMLGQHLYIELDYGQGMTKDGIWLYEEYVILDGANAYVWTEDKDQRLEKKQVTLGEYDEEMMMYEIKAGLTNSDYIAFPDDTLEEGMKTTRNIEEYKENVNIDDEMDIEDVIIEDDIFMEDGEIKDETYMDDEILQDEINVENGIIEEDIKIDNETIEDDYDMNTGEPVGNIKENGYIALYEEA